MGKAPAELGGEEVIKGARNRPLQRRKPRPNAVTAEQRDQFLEELAASCNVKGAARSADINLSTVYRWRQRDEAFRSRWDQALDQGYAGLEAALLEQARLAATGEEAGVERAPVVSGMDAKLAFALLQNHQRYRGREPGEAEPRRSDLPNAIERLERALKRFGKTPPSPSGTEASEIGA